MEIFKAKPVTYNGITFKSTLEARWAVFFDEMGIAWEYEPASFNLRRGVKYTPDFRLKNVKWRCPDAHEIGKVSNEIYVEVKGVNWYDDIPITERVRIEMFAEDYCILVLGTNYDQVVNNFIDKGLNDYLFNYSFLDGDYYACFFSKYKGEIWLCGPDHPEWDFGKSAEVPLAIAKQARF